MNSNNKFMENGKIKKSAKAEEFSGQKKKVKNWLKKELRKV